MIAGLKRKELTLDSILDRISEYDIYRYYLGHDFELGRSFSSPFHQDRDPSFSIILTRSGRLHFTDFGGKNSSGKVIDFVREFYPGRNYNEILRCIDRDLNLGICSVATGNPIVFNGKSKAKTVVYKEPSLIQVVPRNFTTRELAYWNLYHLDRADLLKEPAVYAIKELYVDKKYVDLSTTELAFGYLYDDKYWKIYKPLATSRRDKWISNVPHTLMFATRDLVRGKRVFALKAHKCCKVLRKVTDNVCGFQHEGIGAISPENVNWLKSDFSAVYMNTDPDRAGARTLNYYVSSHGFYPLVVPPAFRNGMVKDLSDLARYRGLDVVEDLINHKITP